MDWKHINKKAKEKFERLIKKDSTFSEEWNKEDFKEWYENIFLQSENAQMYLICPDCGFKHDTILTLEEVKNDYHLTCENCGVEYPVSQYDL